MSFATLRYFNKIKIAYHHIDPHFPFKYKRGMFCRNCSIDQMSSFNVQKSNKEIIVENAASNIKSGPGLEHFISQTTVKPNSRFVEKISHPYLRPSDIDGHGQKVYFEVYGCQMNSSDAEIAWSVLNCNGYKKTSSLQEADVIFIMTCSIREGAETKIWNRLTFLRSIKNKNKESKQRVKIGILGCMAERLRHKLLEQEKIVDLVVGPDSYKDLPRLLAISNNGERVINVLLSHDETYADVIPVSLSSNNMSAYVTIMRGCDNMCSYCVVPFTRGVERSRDISSIVDEVKHLSNQGIKEITLLGQNVNSYRDMSDSSNLHGNPIRGTSMAKGFKSIYKLKKGGRRFADLLDKVSEVDPNMRIRFTSPHPKDFPDEVLDIINERSNICKHIHLPAQCGSSRIMELMRRGYTRESYLELVQHIRSIIPSITLTSDFICGFCSETSEEFEETISLMHEVGYNFCYVFPYSMREKTHAHRKLIDDVPHDVKLERLERMAQTFRDIAGRLNLSKVGERHLVLIEGTSRRSTDHLAGRNDGNTKVIIPNTEIPTMDLSSKKCPEPGDYVEVLITDASSQVLKATPLVCSNIEHFERHKNISHEVRI